MQKPESFIPSGFEIRSATRTARTKGNKDVEYSYKIKIEKLPLPFSYAINCFWTEENMKGMTNDQLAQHLKENFKKDNDYLSVVDVVCLGNTPEKEAMKDPLFKKYKKSGMPKKDREWVVKNMKRMLFTLELKSSELEETRKSENYYRFACLDLGPWKSDATWQWSYTHDEKKAKLKKYYTVVEFTDTK